MHYFSVLFVVACFPSFDEEQAKSFVENPNEDYDGDRLMDAADCDDGDPNVGPQIRYYKDNDNDGFGVESESILVCPQDVPSGYVEGKERNGADAFDCKDDDNTVHPDAQEVCGDDLDNDCDGQVDNYAGQNAPRWYHDRDNDGFGNFDDYVDQCLAPSGYVDNFTDCNDDDPLIHPYVDGQDGGIELCAGVGVDENCNGSVDEASAADAQLWYVDQDQDGYGDTFVVQPACVQPTGYTDQLGDCDDGNSAVSPAAAELCNTIDDNCNLDIDEGVDALAPVNAPTFYADSDGDGYGNANSTTVQCNQPFNHVTDNTDCDDDDSSIFPNAPELCNGSDDDCDGNTDEEDAVDPDVFYADSDGDGFRSASDTQLACNQPTGYLLAAATLDCDDSDSSLHPNATEICDGIDNDCDGLIDDFDTDNLDITLGNTPGLHYFRDSDYDGFGDVNDTIASCQNPVGYVEDNNDCNDGLSSVYPGADETCDGIDNNCDGAIDDSSSIDQTSLYLDNDGDSYGDPDPSTMIMQCLTLSHTGYVLNNFDCDDGNASVNPDSIWYLDADRDTFGNPNVFFQSCLAPMYYVSDNQDCNDLDDEVHPGRTEVCDGKLNRCEDDDGQLTPPADEQDADVDGYVSCTVNSLLDWDGIVILGGDDCDDSDSTEYPNATWYLDDDGDGFGRVDSTTLSCEQPTGYSVIDGDCNDSSAYTYPGAAPLTDPLACLTDFDGNGEADRSWDLCPQEQDETAARFTFIPTNEGPLGYSVATIDDVDGDGLSDVAVGHVRDGTSNNNRGSVFIFFSSSLSFQGSLDTGQADLTIRSLGAGTFGQAIQNAGDVDGDGISDLLINSESGSSTGATYLFLGSTLQQANGTLTTVDAEYFFYGQYNYEYGISSAGDVDGDGLDDVLIGAYGSDAGGTNSGAVYLYLAANLDSTQTMYPAQADYTFVGEESLEYAGVVTNVGDIDQDGLDDILIGTRNPNLTYYYGANRAYLIYGSSLGAVQTIDLSQADVIFEGEAIGYTTYFGKTVANAGDVDGDGVNDLLMGAPYGRNSAGSRTGRTYLFLGSNIGTAQVVSASAADYIFEGPASSDSGGLISGAGDIDGDGLDDILIGEAGGSRDVYLIKGSSLGSANLISLSDSDFIFDAVHSNISGSSEPLISLSGGGDIDGDGLDDVIIGDVQSTGCTSTCGRAYIFSACEN